MKTTLTATLFFLAFISSAQTPSLLKDINPGAALSNYSLQGILFGNKYIFVADDGAHGREPWITDGTTGNTFLLKDINPGMDESNSSDFMIFNNTVFFIAYNSTSGTEMWKTDGTTAGTVMVKDIYPGSNSGFVDYNGNFTIHLRNVWEKNGSFFFIANSDNSVVANNDIELWKSDGTTNGTVRVKDIQPGADGSHPGFFLEFNSNLFFIAYTIANGYELYKSDGTDAGTVLVKDIFPGSNSSFIDYNGQYIIPLTDVWENGGSFYFKANTDNSVNYNNDIELWKTDGTTAGTVRVKDIQPGTEGSDPNHFFVFNNTLFFSAYTISEGFELWKTDGTTGGTIMVKDIFPGSNSGFTDYNGYFYFGLQVVWEKNGYFYFVANTDNSVNYNNDIELWKSDGTTNGTVRVKDIQSGTEGSHPDDFMVFNNTLYFVAYTIAEGYEMWKTDGTGGGTVMVKDIFPGLNSGFIDYNGYAYFGLKNVWEKNGSFYFIANNDDTDPADNNLELWKSDGTAGGTVMVKDISPGVGGSHPRYFQESNGQLFFTTFMANQGQEMWKTDGTTAGTVLVKDIQSGSGSGLSTFYKLFSNGSYFYFTATQLADQDNELWKSDGTTGNTVKVMDINPGTAGSYPNSFVVLPNDIMIFLADDGTHGDELWSMSLPGFTGVEENLSFEFSVYPNPVDDNHLTISLPEKMEGSASIELYDVYGKNVFSKSYLDLRQGDNPITLPELSGGIYFVRIENDGVGQMKKIIVAK